jgi:S1-C subfamily serine protease
MPRALLALAAALLVPVAAVAQPQALPADQLAKIKAATVFVKVSLGDRHGSGSGFVVHAAKDYGLVVTNEHVVSPPTDDLLGLALPNRRPVVEVVFNSGVAGEWETKADVLFTNATDDLALLLVKAVKPIPAPLALDGADKLPETTPVYVCGFPFGEFLAEAEKNPEISIGVASVSSNRTNDKGEVVTVQLNGALNPGNSGGPVVTQQGKLVGVAVRTVKGAGIGFAVPPAQVRRVVQDVHFTFPTVKWVEGATRQLRLESKVIDTQGRLKKVTAQVAPGDAPWAGDDSDDMSKQPGVKPATPALDKAAGTVATLLPAPDDAHVWFQYSWTDADGKARRGRPMWVSADGQRAEPANPFETQPALPPIRPRPNDAGLTGLKGPDGTTLPPVATKLSAITPRDQIDLNDLNRSAARRVGERVTVDLLTTGSHGGYGDGPSLAAFDRLHIKPDLIDFVIDQHLAAGTAPDAFRKQHVAVRVTGTVRQSAAGKSWDLIVVEEVGLLGVSGDVVATYKRKAAFDPKAAAAPTAPVPTPAATVTPPVEPAPAPTPAPTPQADRPPTRVQPKQPAPEQPAAVPPADDGNRLVVMIGLGVAVGVLVAGCIVWASFAFKAKPKKGKGKAGRVSRRDDDDDDDDDRPKSRRRA